MKFTIRYAYELLIAVKLRTSSLPNREASRFEPFVRAPLSIKLHTLVFLS